MGEANFRKLLGMLLQRAWNGKGRELNMERFFKAARKCSGIDIEASMSHWWSNSRCPVFTCNFYLNRKRNQV
jgi:aminopeptidase N